MFFASLNKTNDHIISENSEIFWFSVQIKKDKSSNVIFHIFLQIGIDKCETVNKN